MTKKSNWHLDFMDYQLATMKESKPSTRTKKQADLSQTLSKLRPSGKRGRTRT